ncbi:carotenoid biosynthesis protein [Sunxiuqinia sp. A32]|uniref:carotenoid biosynthesis protein n=1 Tax=Sunxiuqinia sp. A32 TaxID=3461496 RepID=UPI004046376F
MKTLAYNITAVTIGRVFLIVFYIVGLIGFSFPQSRELFKNLIPLNLLLNAFLLFLFHKKWDYKIILFMIGVMLFTFAVEVIGVNKHWLFGNYEYGDTLGPKVMGTPLLIGLNWLILTYCIYASFPGLHSKWFFIVLAAISMVGFDMAMEPVAMQVDMWNWKGGIVPLKNFLDWFLVSLVIFFVMWKMKLKAENEMASSLIIIQFLFFACMNFIVV